MNFKVKLISVIIIYFFSIAFAESQTKDTSKTIALWLFDEQQGIYPSSVINDNSENDFPLVIGLGGQIIDGKFGNALDPIKQKPELIFPDSLPKGYEEFGLSEMKIPARKTQPPMTWMNAEFCALMTMGENHLRKEVGFKNPTKTKLNIGNFDWTIEFWFKLERKTNKSGIVFEIGEGPRGENNKVTYLALNSDLKEFILYNYPSGTELKIPTNINSQNITNSGWYHLAFVYNSNENQLYHFVDGRLQKLPRKCNLKSLSEGSEAYMSIGRNGVWKEPLQGKIDELRFSEGNLYKNNFNVPESFSPFFNGNYKEPTLKKGLPLLFSKKSKNKLPIELGNRKYVFIDDAIIDSMHNINFVVNPPKKVQKVFDDIPKSFRKHLTVVEDDSGLIRIYNSYGDDYLGVITSKDGIHFKKPNLIHHKSDNNIVIPEEVGGLGNPFIDPNGTGDQKWKYVSGFHNRGIYLYTSPDGWKWKRQKTYVLPFRSGTQSCTFYDDQRQLYVGYHRTGIFHTPGGATQRSSSLTEVKNIYWQWKYKILTQQDYLDSAKVLPLRQPLPWYLDNGPLTPGGFGLELPHKFDPAKEDPVGTDIYVTKAQKYKWAPDTYLAFPIVYFHYEKDGPKTRQILGNEDRGRGSGPIETQIAVSRDGVNWKRYFRPAYIGIGNYCGDTLHQIYIADGMVKRGDEIWQYFYGKQEYHSSWSKKHLAEAVYRVVQRLDGFISADSPYDKNALIITKPFLFKGNRMELNINTGAAGFAQVGFLDETGNPIKDFSVDDCIYINGNFINTDAEWLNKGKGKSIPSGDISSLEGKTVRLIFRMRGTKLYSMQFKQK